jgi:hypothetical protein
MVEIDAEHGDAGVFVAGFQLFHDRLLPGADGAPGRIDFNQQRLVARLGFLELFRRKGAGGAGMGGGAEPDAQSESGGGYQQMTPVHAQILLTTVPDIR